MLNFRRSNRETNDGIERAPDGSPRLSFWDPALKESRKKYFKITGLTTIAVFICCFTLLPLYVGLYWSQEPDAYRLTVRIIDLDSQASPSTSTFPAVLGPAVVQSVEQDLREKPNFHLGWQFEPDLERFSLNGENGNDRGIDADEYARHIVLNQDVFAAVVIHANATTALNQAFRSGSADYQSNGAVSLYYEEARNFYSTNQYVVFYTSIMLESAFASAASTFTSRVLSEASSATGGFNFTALSTSIAPQPPFSSVNSTSLLTQPFSRSTFNLRPFDQLAGVSATTAGEIYLIIFTFFIGLGFKQAFDPLAPKLTLGSELFLRIAVPFAGYFWISCHYSLVSLAFQVDFTRKYGMVGFFLFWMMNFVSMSGLGFVMEFVLLALGPLYFPIFLLFWVILNVTGAFVDLSDQSRFYLYNFVLPVWNAVDAAKSIMFGTKNHLLQNFVVNTSWLIFGASAILLTAVYKRSKASRDARAKLEKAQ